MSPPGGGHAGGGYAYAQRDLIDPTPRASFQASGIMRLGAIRAQGIRVWLGLDGGTHDSSDWPQESPDNVSAQTIRDNPLGASGNGSWLVPAPATFDGLSGTGGLCLPSRQAALNERLMPENR